MTSEMDSSNKTRSRIAGGLLILCVVGIPNAFPAYQFLKTGGYLFYTNAYDEYSYLSYEGSLSIQGILRPFQYLVTLCHEMGMSAGAINLIWDVVCVGIIAVFLRKIFLELGFNGHSASLGTFLVVFLPVCFGVANPYYAQIFNANLTSGSIFWITLPEAYFPGFFRTPDPQISWMLVILAGYFSLKKRSFTPMYLVIPFLLEILKITVLFIVLSLHLSRINERKRFLDFKYANLLIGAIVYIAISGLMTLSYKIFIAGGPMELSVVQTHLPLVSGSACAAILIYFLGKRLLNEKIRLFAIFAAVAPMVAVNTQVFSGFIVSPSNFEQYFGVNVVVLLVTLMVISKRSYLWVKYSFGFVGVCLMMAYTVTIFRNHVHPLYTSELSVDLKADLKNRSSRVVLEDSRLASTMSMVFPRQSLTALAYTQTYIFAAKNHFERYLCLKAQIKEDGEQYERYKKSFETLDQAYKYQNTNFVLLHIQRKTDFGVFFDPDKKPQNCDQASFLFYPPKEK